MGARALRCVTQPVDARQARNNTDESDSDDDDDDEHDNKLVNSSGAR